MLMEINKMRCDICRAKEKHLEIIRTSLTPFGMLDIHCNKCKASYTVEIKDLKEPVKVLMYGPNKKGVREVLVSPI